MWSKTPPQMTAGQGELMVGRDTAAVTYSYNPAAKGTATGSVRGARDHIKAAFSRGEGKLRLSDGSELELRFVAHTAGSDLVFFEIVRR